MEDLAIIRREFANKRAAEYRSRGYEVWQDEPLDFMPGFRADLLVRKNDETRVIAVQTRTGLSVTPALKELAEVISPMPGWSFDLLLVSEPERLDKPECAKPLDAAGISRSIAEAESALHAGFRGAAFLMAWSACEAAVRILLAAEDFEIDRITQARYILGHAVFRGVISHNDHGFLSDMLAYRNAIVHGFEVEDFDAERTIKLIAAANKLERACAALELADGASVVRVDALNPLDVPARLDELRGMQDGWLDGNGKAPSLSGLDWLSTAFQQHFPDDAPLPFTYPTPEGSIQLEWTLGTQDVSLRVDLNARSAIWHRLDLSDISDDGEEEELNLDDVTGWNWLSKNILQLSEESQ